MSAVEECPACGGPLGRGPALDGGRALLVCARCGHGVLTPSPTEEELDAAYHRAYGSAGMKFRPLVERAVRLAASREADVLAAFAPAPHRRVLDVGCGRGVLLGALADRGLSCVGVERSREAAIGLDPRVQLVVAPSLEAAGLSPASFGIITFRHSLEHLREPRDSLRTARRLLAPGGALIVEVPNRASVQARVLGRHWFHLDPPRHLHHFTPASLAAMLSSAGFDVAEVAHGAVLQDVMGWLQGALHAAGRPTMALYDGLHAQERPPVLDLVLGVAIGPAALAVAAAERLAGGGAVVKVRAKSTLVK